jgi:hypothetical protein
MPKLVQIGNDVAEFPDDMPDEQISLILSQKNMAPIPGDNPNKQPNPDMKEQSIVDKYLGPFMAGAAAVPLLAGTARVASLGLAGSRAAKPAAAVAKAMMPASGTALAIEGVGGGVAGVAGKAAGDQFEPGWKRDTAGFLAGATVGLPFTVAATAEKVIREKALDGIKKVGTEAADAYGKYRANKAATVAIDANPELVPNVLKSQDLAKTLGAPLPVLAQANGDTTLSGYINSQIARGENAAFTAEIRNKYLNAEKALAQKRNGLAPSMEDVDAFVRQQAKMDEAANTAAEKAFQAESAKRQAAIDKLTADINDVGSKLEITGGKEYIGTRLTNLISAREAVLQKKLSANIEKTITDGEKAGVTLKGSAAAALKDYVVDEKKDAVFQSFPQLYGLIQKVFTPKNANFSESLKKKGYTIAKPETAAQDYSLRDLDSLKIRVNEDLRKAAPNSPEQRLLSELKSKVAAAIDSTDPAFSVPYKAAQDDYYRELGIPFRNANGVLMVDRANFVEQTVPVLTSKASSLREALTAMGHTDDAYRVATDAFMLKLSQTKSIVKDTGEVNPAKLSRFIEENKEQIDLVPGLKAKLEGVANNADSLLKRRGQLLEQEKQAKFEKAETLWTQAYTTPGGLAGAVKQALSVPKKMDELLEVMGKNPDALQAVRGALLDDLLKSPQNRVELFAKHRDAINKIYGADVADDISKLVEISQRLKDNPFDFKIQPNTVTKTGVQKQTGSSPEQLAGEIRNPILSAHRKLFNVISRYFTNRSNKAHDAEIQRLLLNPEILIDAKNYMVEIDAKGITSKAISLMAKMLQNQGFALAMATAGGLEAHHSTKKEEPFKVSDPTLLEGFRK